jgi:hypothetical protein
MIRLTSLLIVLTLAGLPTATAVCLAWCDMEPSGAADCDHTERAAVLTHEDSCAVLVGSAFIRQDIRVGTDVVPALPVAPSPAALTLVTAAPLIRGDWRFVGSPPRAHLVLRL